MRKAAVAFRVAFGAVLAWLGPTASALPTGSVAEEMVGRINQTQSDPQRELPGDGREMGTLG